MNFWSSLPKPFFVLAPMDDVTDLAFRQVVTSAAAPDVLFTEFVSIDGLQSAGRERTLERLRIEPNLDRPLVAQIWGSDPEKYRLSAADVASRGFDGIDINLGCPERGIVARGCCGGLIGHNEHVRNIIQATKAGSGGLPVSVKTRIGLNQIITEEWAGFLLGQDLAALTIHGRTVREMSRVPARWDEIAKVAALRLELGVDTVIIGNGDVESRAHGHKLAADTSVDGIMIGRGIFRDIFVFEQQDKVHEPTEMLQILLHHLDLYEQTRATKPYATLKKFFKIYVNSWDGASDLRVELMNTTTPDEARRVVRSYHVPTS